MDMYVNVEMMTEFMSSTRRGQCHLIWQSNSGRQVLGQPSTLHLFVDDRVVPRRNHVKSMICKFETGNLKKKLKISFNDKATATHEYQSENAALHDYLVIHPTEEEEVKKQAEEEEKTVIKLEDFEYADETSDDAPETPRNGSMNDSSSIRSNTPLSGAGSFGGYKSKMSVEFEFGMSMAEEPPVASPDPDPVENTEERDLLPMAEDETFNWTDNSSADLLF